MLSRSLKAGLLFAFWALLTDGAGAESLYKEETFRPLTADHRAYRVGDALTVLVFENSSASSSADTTTNKTGGTGISFHNPNTNTDKKPRLDLSEDFTGSGKINRSGKLLAQLTVNVKAVAPNGDLFVAGTQLIEVNGEKQSIVLEGRVRPVDISDGNAVVSSRLADAKISYVGDGVISERQRPGFLIRILSLLGLL